MSGNCRRSRLSNYRSEDLSSDPFRPLSENELSELPPDDLIAYIRKATDAGRGDDAKSALSILCWRFHADVERRIALRVPREEVEDAAMTVMLAAIKSAFEGTSIGEFRSWLNRIIDRRGIADYHRAREDKPKPGPLPAEHLGEEEIWGDEPSEQDETGRVLLQSLVDETLAELQSDSHRLVIEITVYEGLGAAKAAARVNAELPDLETKMSEANVHQIMKRFRESLRGKLRRHG